MLVNKKLYVVRSAHMVKHKKINVEYKVKDILEVRVKTIEALARTIKLGAFFSDSLFREHTDEFNKILKSPLISSEHIKEFAKKNYTKKNYQLYDDLRVLEMFKSIREIGCYFKYRTTEKEDNGSIEKDVFSKAYEVYHTTKELDEEEIRGIFKGALERDNIKRERKIISNIKNRGLEENILYMGIGHKLEEIESSGLEYYSISIMHAKDDHNMKNYISIEGTLPYCFEKNMLEAFKTKDNKKHVRFNINYV